MPRQPGHTLRQRCSVREQALDQFDDGRHVAHQAGDLADGELAPVGLVGASCARFIPASQIVAATAQAS